VAVFRDELPGLLDDADARRLARQTFLLSDLLEKQLDGYHPPRLAGRALVQPQCHHPAVLCLGAETARLTQLGLDYELLDAGCCGVARVIRVRARPLRGVGGGGRAGRAAPDREAPPETFILADGFSGREQIAEATGRRPVHIADLIDRGLAPSVAHETGATRRVPAGLGVRPPTRDGRLPDGGRPAPLATGDPRTADVTDSCAGGSGRARPPR
jgi:hypothetical protein